ncbi:Rec8 like protein-domain-containing protein [Dactylonectria estremocensis]|uniref:Rec8 like protein-domain-containing protein n=1 Tax=Dactylonectria estremocensis TaxID=1079267 RepID=A0A9P9JBM6_9HYPO|nr:Rec8 like protein-domain-containing protein [Dactylonectria estremocensis]
MFYSHEILSNAQYGVSTIWLVATVGKTTHRKVTRKAIQEVNVPKACEKIIDPGAPLALRLQGNLLYGVSRVFAQQCHYVLSDAEKTQSDMLTFFRVMQTSELDPKAGKSKRHQITLQDDPAFDLASIFPKLDLFTSNKELVLLSSQNSAQSVSQMTPLSQGTLSSSGNPAFLPFELLQSSCSGGSYRLPSDLGRNSPTEKRFGSKDSMPEYNPFGDEDMDPIAGIGLNFDADGNLIEMPGPEPDLPFLPGEGMHDPQVMYPDAQRDKLHQGKGIELLGEDNVIIMGEDALPDAEPFPKQPTKRPNTPSLTTESALSEKASAPFPRGRPRKPFQLVDETDHVSREEIRNWTNNYAANMDARRKKPQVATKAQARKNAIALLFDNGISNVGMFQDLSGFVHPLAQDFSGAALEASLQGRHPKSTEERGRVRSSSEAFEEEEIEKRKVRQKVNGELEFGRGQIDDLGALILGDESAPELGLDAAPALEDHPFSSMIPWSRPQSAVPGSAIRGLGSAQKGYLAPSPLHARGSVVGSIERYSDLPGPAHGSGDYAHLHSQDSSVGNEGFDDYGGIVNNQDTQGSTQGLDTSSLKFYRYAADKALREGRPHRRGDPDRRWVDFEKLADPATHTKCIAAQAFLHVLSLATKNMIAVEQKGIANQQPFGTLLLGIKPEQEDVEMDELA